MRLFLATLSRRRASAINGLAVVAARAGTGGGTLAFCGIAHRIPAGLAAKVGASVGRIPVPLFHGRIGVLRACLNSIQPLLQFEALLVISLCCGLVLVNLVSWRTFSAAILPGPGRRLAAPVMPPEHPLFGPAQCLEPLFDL